MICVRKKLHISHPFRTYVRSTVSPLFFHTNKKIVEKYKKSLEGGGAKKHTIFDFLKNT